MCLLSFAFGVHCSTQCRMFSEWKTIERMPKFILLLGFLLSFSLFRRKYTCTPTGIESEMVIEFGNTDDKVKNKKVNRTGTVHTQPDYLFMNNFFFVCVVAMYVCSILFLIITNAMNNEYDASKPWSLFQSCQSDQYTFVG